HNPTLHSFPTRRSSDLIVVGLRWLVNQIAHRAFSQVEVRGLAVGLCCDDYIHPSAARAAAKRRHDGFATRHVAREEGLGIAHGTDRKSTRLNSSHLVIS